MRILTFKRLLGLAAIGYGYNYAKKHGGVQNAWNELMGKARMAIDRGRQTVRDAAVDVSSTTTGATSGMSTSGLDEPRTTGYSSGYTSGTGGYGGTGGNRGL
jgi:hypothetical protein